MADLVDVVEVVVPDGDGHKAFEAVRALLDGDDGRSPGLEQVTRVRLLTRRELEGDHD